MAITEDAGDVPTLDDLFVRESDILERLRHKPNGEQYFMLHPLRALEDIGVRLGNDAMAPLPRMHPDWRPSRPHRTRR